MITRDFIPTIKYTPYLIFYKNKRNYVYDLEAGQITDNLSKAQLFDTKEEAKKAMKKVLFRLCPKELYQEYDIIDVQATKEKKLKKPDDLSVKNYLISECLKKTVYDRIFLEKQTNKQLEWLLSNYKKRHFITEEKIILAVKS
jgi:hypothetical protein